MTAEERSELIKYRFQRAKKALSEAEHAIKYLDWNLAVNRLYYACFYASTALLAEMQVDARTHSGVKRMIGLNFVKTGEISNQLNDFYAKIFDMRQSGDYEDFCDYEKSDVLELIKPANEFVSTIERILYKK